MSKPKTPDRIYLIDMGADGLVWCDDPAPGTDMDADDAVEYVRVGAAQQDAPTDAVMQAGAILSNIAFNMAQRVGEILDSNDVSVLDAARLAWDRAVRTNHAPAQDSDRNAEGLTLHQLYEDACIAANANARDADWLKFMLAEVRRDGMEMLLAALHDEDGFPLSHDRAVAALAAARAQRAGKEGA